MQNAKSTSNKRVPIQGEGVECPLEDLVCEVGEGEEVEEPADASLLEEEKVALTAGPVVLDESGPYQTCRTGPIQVPADWYLARRWGGRTHGKAAEIRVTACTVPSIVAASEKGTEEDVLQGDVL